MQLSEYELEREQRVNRNREQMGILVRALLFLYFKSFVFADCGGLFREFRSWFSSSIQSNQKLHRTDVEMLQPNLITYFGGGKVISTLLFREFWNIRCEFPILRIYLLDMINLLSLVSCFIF